MIHLKLMIFMLLNNRYLFIFRILFICLLILAMLGLFCWVQPFLVVASRGYSRVEMCWLLLLAASHRRAWDRGVGIGGHGPRALVGCSVVVVLGLSCSTVCGVFLDRDPTCISVSDQWILNHRNPREVPFHAFLYEKRQESGLIEVLFGTELLFSCSVVCISLWPHGMQHARLPCPSPSPSVCSNSCPLCRWCHPTISSFLVPFSSCPQSFPGSGFLFFVFFFPFIMVYIFTGVYD